MLGIKGALDAGKDVEQKWYERLGVDFSSTNLRPIRGSMYRAIMLSVSKLTGLGNAHQAISKRKSLARIKEADIQAVVAAGGRAEDVADTHLHCESVIGTRGDAPFLANAEWMLRLMQDEGDHGLLGMVKRLRNSKTSAKDHSQLLTALQHTLDENKVLRPQLRAYMLAHVCIFRPFQVYCQARPAPSPFP